MSKRKVIHHSDRVDFTKTLQQHLDSGWYPIQMTVAQMRGGDIHIAILEYGEEEIDSDRLAQIAAIVQSVEKRRNLTDKDFEAIKRLSGA
jgi:hypothetical protein